MKHYLIFSGGGLVVSVNGNVVTSGYELKNADVINIDNNIGTISGIKTNSTLVVNGTTYTGMSDDINLNLSNTDINITYTAGSGFGPYVGFTINYTESSTSTLISFTIEDEDTRTYQAEEGMTWGEWVNSSYNTDGYSVETYYDVIIKGTDYNICVRLSSADTRGCSSTDKIITNYKYYYGNSQ